MISEKSYDNLINLIKSSIQSIPKYKDLIISRDILTSIFGDQQPTGLFVLSSMSTKNSIGIVTKNWSYGLEVNCIELGNYDKSYYYDYSTDSKSYQNMLETANSMVDQVFSSEELFSLGNEIVSNSLKMINRFYPRLYKSLLSFKFTNTKDIETLGVRYLSSLDKVELAYNPSFVCKGSIIEFICNLLNSNADISTITYDDFINFVTVVGSFYFMHEVYHIIYRHVADDNKNSNGLSHLTNNYIQDSYINKNLEKVYDNNPLIKPILNKLGKGIVMYNGVTDNYIVSGYLNPIIANDFTTNNIFDGISQECSRLNLDSSSSNKLKLSNFIKDNFDQDDNKLILVCQNLYMQGVYKDFSHDSESLIKLFIDNTQKTTTSSTQTGSKGSDTSKLDDDKNSSQINDQYNNPNKDQSNDQQNQSDDQKDQSNDQQNEPTDQNPKDSTQDNKPTTDKTNSDKDKSNLDTDKNKSSSKSDDNQLNKDQTNPTSDLNGLPTEPDDQQGQQSSSKEEPTSQSTDTSTNSDQGSSDSKSDQENPSDQNRQQSSNNSTTQSISTSSPSNTNTSIGTDTVSDTSQSARKSSASIDEINNMPDKVNNAVKDAAQEIINSNNSGRYYGSSQIDQSLLDIADSDSSKTVVRDWRVKLKFMVEKSTGVLIKYNPDAPNPRIEGQFGRENIDQQLGDLILSFDISGSMSIDDFKAALFYIQNMMKMGLNFERVGFAYWSTRYFDVKPKKVNPSRVYNIAKQSNPGFSGGTWLTALIDPFVEGGLKSSRPDLIIIFTDGYINRYDDLDNKHSAWFNKYKRKILWVLKGESGKSRILKIDKTATNRIVVMTDNRIK